MVIRIRKQNCSVDSHPISDLLELGDIKSSKIFAEERGTFHILVFACIWGDLLSSLSSAFIEPVQLTTVPSYKEG